MNIQEIAVRKYAKLKSVNDKMLLTEIENYNK